MTRFQPKVSIIVVTFNSGGLVEKLIDSLLSLTYDDYEIIVVDNGSTDNTVGLIGSKYGLGAKGVPLRLVRLGKNYGVSYGWNVGSTLANGKYLLILDHDMVITEDLLTKLVEYYETSERAGVRIGAVQPACLSLDGRRVHNIGMLNTKLPVVDPETRVKLGDVEVLFPIGIFLVKREAWKQIGGFDTEIFWDFTDADFGWRLWMAGYSVISIAFPVVYHRDYTIHTRFRYFHYAKGFYRMHFKNWQSSTIICFLPFIVLQIILSISKERFRSEVVGAVASIARHPKELLQARLLVQRRRKLRDRELMSVLWFFIPIPWFRECLRRRAYYNRARRIGQPA